jgi:hypothetical protein
VGSRPGTWAKPSRTAWETPRNVELSIDSLSTGRQAHRYRRGRRRQWSHPVPVTGLIATQKAGRSDDLPALLYEDGPRAGPGGAGLRRRFPHGLSAGPVLLTKATPGSDPKCASWAHIRAPCARAVRPA